MINFDAVETASQHMEALRTHCPEAASADFRTPRRELIPCRPADIRANDGNLSIPFYVRRIDMRGKAVGEEQGEYATNGLKETIKAWSESSEKLEHAIKYMIQTLGGQNENP